MAKTFNRPPLSVSTPSSSDVKQYFFNHYNWKGLNDDKNFLATDQETFGDCNNVYVDSEGLLKSRPAQKIKIVKVTVNGEEAVLANIVNTWVFEYVTVYQSEHNGQNYLTFVNSSTNVNVQEPLQDAAIKLIVADEKIFVFSETSLSYYDMRTNEYGTAEDFIHIPVVKVITDGFVDAAADVESPNLLTNSYITKYLYTSAENIDFDNFVGKDVTVEVDGIQYPVNFVYNNQLVFVGRYTGLSQYNFADDKILGVHGEGTPLVQVGSNGSMIISSYSYTLDETTKTPTISWTIYHTNDGVIFNRVPDIDGIIGMPKISRDGIYCIVFKQDGPYIYSLLESKGNEDKLELVYPTWQNLLAKINPTEYEALHLNLNETRDSATSFNQSVVVNGYFFDDKLFAFVYGSNLEPSNGNTPWYYNFDCIYSGGDNKIHKQPIFNSDFYSLISSSTNSPVNVKPLDFEAVDSTGAALGDKYGIQSANIPTLISFAFTDSAHDNHNVTVTISNAVYYKFDNQPDSDKTVIFTRHLEVKDNNTNKILFSNDLKDVNESYEEVHTSGHGVITSYNSWTFQDDFFKYTIQSYEAANAAGYRESFSVELLKNIYSIHLGSPVDGNFLSLHSTMPNVYAFRTNINDVQGIKIMIDYVANFTNKFGEYRGIYCIEQLDNSNTSSSKYIYKTIYDWQSFDDYYNYHPPIRGAYLINNTQYIFARLERDGDNQNTVVRTWTFGNVTELTETTVLTEPAAENFYDQSLVLSDPSGYLLTGKYLFDYNNYTDTTADYKPIELLFPVKPVAYYYQGNSSDNLYLATSNALYTNTGNKVITVSEVTKGDNNYFLPSFYTQLSNYYLSKGNELYISAPSFSLEIDSSGKLRREKSEFKWYFPKIAKQTFDYNITNLHVISDTDVAIFFEHSVTLVRWDSDASAYVYYNSKLQAGCKMGCDVLTTYDGKYVIFTSGRGLVAMTYQEFMATTEQTLQYLSDTIYSVYNKYITEPTSTNHIKLFKYGYWILIYKPDSNKGFIFDIRNNSWWPVTSLHNVKKLIQRNEKIELLSNGSMYDLSTLETDYFDNDGKKHKIPWFLKSQKLYLNAPNYYKHIINLTFMSVHDKQLLQNSNYNVDELNFILQANNYRKRINGNIGSEDDYTSISYNVESIRTYVQRLNYSKVNEFEYLLSSDEESAIDIPLSLSSITIKYKIGSQVR